MNFIKAQFDDAEVLATLIKRVAEEQGRPQDATITASILQEDGFSPHPAFHAYLACSQDAQIVGFSFYYFMYSGWQGRKILFLEDLYILPEHRGKGYGSLFFQKMAQLADQEGIKMAWETNRNRYSTRNYYESLGAQDRPNKVGFFMEGAALTQLAQEYNATRLEVNIEEAHNNQEGSLPPQLLKPHTDQESSSNQDEIDHLI